MTGMIVLRIVLELCNEQHNAVLLHNQHDDSRYIELPNKVKVKFDAHCQVFLDTKNVGHITTINDVYHLKKSGADSVDLGVNCNNWHWKSLEDAEIKVAIHLYKEMQGKSFTATQPA